MNNTRQYIGARYVPKFADPIAWDKNNSYEALTIVTYLNNSYTSKKPVPVGVEITNNEYWAVTGNYNAQVEQYRQEVEDVANSLTEKTTVYASVNKMKTNTEAKIGDYLITANYRSDVNGGGMTYAVVGSSNSVMKQSLASGLYAEPVISDYLAPECFGCVGNGVTDDTANLQMCITFCEDNGITLKSSAEKRYLITDNLLISKSNLICDFGNAVIVNNSNGYAIYINKDATDYLGARNVTDVVLKNVRIECSTTGNCGVDTACDECRVSNLRITNCGGVGVNARLGGGTVFEKIYIEGTTSRSSVGVIVGSSDSIFNQINGLNCYTFIRVNSPCELTKLHSWIGNKDLYAGSTYLEINCAPGTILRDSNVDTYSIVFKFNGVTPTINMNNCVVIYYNGFIGSNDNTYFYYQRESSARYMRGFEQIIGCIVQKPTNGMYYLCNTNTDNKSFCINTTSCSFPFKGHDEVDISEFNNNNTFDGQMVVNYGKYIRINGTVTVTSTDKNLLYVSINRGYLRFPKTHIVGTVKHNGSYSTIPLYFSYNGDQEVFIQRDDGSALTVGDVYTIDATISWRLD